MSCFCIRPSGFANFRLLLPYRSVMDLPPCAIQDLIFFIYRCTSNAIHDTHLVSSSYPWIKRRTQPTILSFYASHFFVQHHLEKNLRSIKRSSLFRLSIFILILVGSPSYVHEEICFRRVCSFRRVFESQLPLPLPIPSTLFNKFPVRVAVEKEKP